MGLEHLWLQRRSWRNWPWRVPMVAYAGLSWLRRMAYRLRLRKPVRIRVPVVVVGNMTVGGSGKTPLTLTLARSLADMGWCPGIVSRGYGRQGGDVRAVSCGDSPRTVGDEPLLLARESGCPVWVGRRRPEAAQALLAAHPEVNVILCDDGLQHLRLARDFQVAVVDRRGFGNGLLLPAGPLRESPANLRKVDAIVAHDTQRDEWPPGVPVFSMRLVPIGLKQIGADGECIDLSRWAGKRVHAVAGIGEPARFFDMLRAHGMEVTSHAYVDHHDYIAADLDFGDDLPILMTSKDAVKCAALDVAGMWEVPVRAELEGDLPGLIVERLNGPQASGNPRVPGDKSTTRL